MSKKDCICLIVKQQLWLLMALCCVVFCGASKRLIEFRAETKIHGQYSAGVVIDKKIKNGSRDNRQYFSTLAQAGKHTPGHDGLDFFIVAGLICHAAHPFSEKNGATPKMTLSSGLAGGVRLYLLHRRLQV